MWYSLENGKDCCLGVKYTLNDAELEARNNPMIKEIFEYDNNDEFTVCNEADYTITERLDY